LWRIKFSRHRAPRFWAPADYFAAGEGVAAGNGVAAGEGVAAEGVAAEGVAAGEGFFWAAARSFSTAALQRALKLALCLSMHASVFWIFGPTELQRRHASAAHFARVSAVQAKLGVERAEKETAKAAMRKTGQMVLVKSAIIVELPGRPSGTLLMSQPCLSLTGLTVTSINANHFEESDGAHIHLSASGVYSVQRVEATMSKKFVNRITLVSVLAGALLAVSVVLPLHTGQTGVNSVTANQHIGAGNHG
jgi:hypothetical protein